MSNSKKTSQDVKQSIVAITSVDKKVVQKLESAYNGTESKKWVIAFQLGKCLLSHKERMNNDKKTFTQYAKDNGSENAWHYYVKDGLGLTLTYRYCDDLIRMYKGLKGEKTNVTVAEMKTFVEEYALTRNECKSNSFWNARTIEKFLKNGGHIAKKVTSQDVKKTVTKKAPKANISHEEHIKTVAENNGNIAKEGAKKVAIDLKVYVDRLKGSDLKEFLDELKSQIRDIETANGIK
tara:strand:+ start:3773 stop:4480 length:708 start_codon:yes stop_codon:yes gene_type:complete